MKKIICFLSIFALTVCFNAHARTQPDSNKVQVNIEGLSCSFCAYGLEKSIKDLDGAGNVKIDIEKGLLTFSLTGSKGISEEKIRKVVKEAGFTPKAIKFRQERVDKKKD